MSVSAISRTTGAQEVCPSAPWRNLPLATKPAPLSQLDIANYMPYIKASLVPHVVGALVALAIALLLLLSFLTWRLVKCCTCCACVRGPRRTGKAARKVLTGRGVRVLKSLVLGAAAGALAAGVFGVTQVDGSLVDGGLVAIDGVIGFVDAAVDAGQATIAATQAMDTQLLATKVALQGMGPAAAPMVAPYIQAIDDTHATLAGFTTSFASDLTSIRDHTAGKISAAVGQHTPLARRINHWRVVALYVAYSLLAGLAVVVAVGALVDWPAAVKPLALLLLILLVVAWVLVAALTAALRVGNDVCVHAEAKIQAVVGGSGGFSLGGGSGGASALVTYYLTGAGGGVLQVINDTMGVDVAASLSQANDTLVSLKAAIESDPTLAAAVGDEYDALLALYTDVTSSVDGLIWALSYASFHPVWISVKGFVCCTVLNSVGATWTGLVVCATFGLLLMFPVFTWIGRMDSLRPQGCCHIYSQRDYTLEGDGCGGGDGGYGAAYDSAALAKKKQAAAAGFDAFNCPPSPTIMARADVPSSARAPTPAWTSPSLAKASRCNRVAPEPDAHSVRSGGSSGSMLASSGGGGGLHAGGGGGGGGLYPSVFGGGCGVKAPTAAAAAPASPAHALMGSAVPDDVALRLEAERAAQLAGQAYSMASQAQGLLDVIARSSSRINTAGSGINMGGLGPSAPPSPTVGGGPGSPGSGGYASAFSSCPASPAGGGYSPFAAPAYTTSPPPR